MRSAVSTILSETSDPSPMAHPDYLQVAADHKRHLVLVRSVSPSTLKPKVFAKVFEVLDRCQSKVTVKSADDLTRHIEARFLRTYPVENNEWGDFQFHRSVLGFVSVGTFKTEHDKIELERLHEALKQKYQKTLLCSRLIALKDSDERLSTEKQGEIDHWATPPVASNGEKNNALLKPPRRSATTGPHDNLEYNLHELDEKALESDTVAFLTTMFWLLEKTRVEKIALETSGKNPPFLYAPFERRDFVGLDLESRTNKRRTIGRFKKHIADLNLMCGLVKEAYELYDQASELLRTSNDWLWLANSMEGMFAISAIIYFPTLDRTNSLKRNASFQDLSGRNFSKKKDRDESKKEEWLKKRVASPTQMIELLRELVVHYSKYKHAGVIETEACIKAVQVLIAQGNSLLAAEFLQNLVFINLNMSEEEKVQRYTELSKLYLRIGFRRKAAFFNRVAAMRCVCPQNPNVDWIMCYQLLLKTLTGYNINFQEPLTLSRRESGWPDLQLQILNELVGTARRTGDHVAATRHMVFIMQNLFHHIQEESLSEYCTQLSLLTSKSPGTPVPHSVEGGLILPPVNIYTIPRVVSFEPCSVMEPLIPPSSDVESSNESPFIFTPIQAKTGKKQQIVSWVQDEVASVELSVINPLPIELKISNLSLMHEGVEFDAFQSAFALEPKSGPTKLRLSGLPKKPGLLNIMGYHCDVFGVRSHCRLKSLGLGLEDHFLIEVCPSIPRLEMTVRVEHEDNFFPSTPVSSPLKVDVYQGESRKLEFSFLNASSLSVENLIVSLSTLPLRFSKAVSKGEVNERIDPGEKMSFEITLHGPQTLCDRRDMFNEAEEEMSTSAKVTSFDLSVVLKYTSDSEKSNGYCRQLVQKVNVTFMPSLVTTWWDILPGENSGECYVVFDLKNETENEIDLQYAKNKRIVIDPLGLCRVPIKVDKVECPETEVDAQKKFFAEYLDRMVSLLWEINEGKLSRRGQVSLANLNLEPPLMARLEKTSVSWTVLVNDERWCGNEVSVPCGEPMTICVDICNNYDSSMDCALLCHCEYVNGSSSSEMASISLQRVPLSGSRTVRDCPPGEAAAHSFSLIPYFPGKMCVTTKCEVFKSGTSDHLIDDFHFPLIYVVVT